jgi:hypothetical protein
MSLASNFTATGLWIAALFATVGLWEAWHYPDKPELACLTWVWATGILAAGLWILVGHLVGTLVLLIGVALIGLFYMTKTRSFSRTRSKEDGQ